MPWPVDWSNVGDLSEWEDTGIVSRKPLDAAKTASSSAGNKATTAAGAKSGPGSSDRLQLSDQASQLQALEAKVSSLPVVDTQRVQDVQRTLATGSFQIEPAKVADKMTVIRSMTHGEAAHERGTHNMFTGYRPSPAIEYPSIGSVISPLLGGVTPASSRHPGGAHVMMADGAVRLVADSIDAVAERIRALGLPAPQTFAEFDRRSAIDDLPEKVELKGRIERLVTDYETAARRAAETVKLAESYGDIKTADLLTDRIGVYDDNAWMLRATIATS